MFQVEQEIYFTQLQHIVLLLKYLTKANDGRDPPGFFSKEEFRSLISEYSWPREHTAVDALMAAAEAELNEGDESDVIEYTKLFFEVQ